MTSNANQRVVGPLRSLRVIAVFGLSFLPLRALFLGLWYAQRDRRHSRSLELLRRRCEGTLATQLPQYMEEASLERKVEDALQWCDEQGAESLEEVVENIEDFAADIGLATEERQSLENVFQGLHSLAEAGDVDRLQACIHPRKLEVRDDAGRRPLHLAVTNGHARAVALLLERRSNVWARDAAGLTPLHSAAFSGHAPIVEILLEHGAPPNKKENRQASTPLHGAVRNGHLPCIELLLDRGADIHQKDAIGRDALHWSCFWGQADTAQLLLDRGARNGRENQDSGSGAEPLHWAAWKGHVELVNVLIEGRADASTRSRECMTPLHFAAEGGHVETVQALLGMGVQAAPQTEHLETPLQLALQRLERGHAGPGGNRITGGEHAKVVDILEAFVTK